MKTNPVETPADDHLDRRKLPSKMDLFESYSVWLYLKAISLNN